MTIDDVIQANLKPEVAEPEETSHELYGDGIGEMQSRYVSSGDIWISCIGCIATPIVFLLVAIAIWSVSIPTR